MKIIIRKLLIVLLITIVPSIDGFSDTYQGNGDETEKAKTNICCKMVKPRPVPGPWTIINQIPVKVCREIQVDTNCD